MLTLGIIGGMGPEATQVMYREIIARTDAGRDQDHIDILIYSHASMPDRTAAIESGDTAGVRALLAADARKLRAAGADILAVPCNTSHNFISDIEKAVDIPVINMIEETAGYIRDKRPEMKKVGILATEGTVRSGLYQKALESRGITPFVPDAKHQKTVMSIIYEQIKAGQKGDRDDFAAVDLFMKKNGCDGAILGCTELSVFRANHELDSYYVDAMGVLVERCITLCGGKLKGDNE